MVDLIKCIQGKVADLSEAEADELINNFHDIVDYEMKARGASYEHAMGKAKAKLENQRKFDALRRKRDLLINRRREGVRKQRKELFKAQGYSEYDAMFTDYVGTVRGLVEGKYSIDNRIKESHQRWLAKFQYRLKKDGLFEIAQQKDMELPIARAYQALTSPGQGINLKDVPDIAKKIAKVFYDVNNELRVSRNEAGAYIGELEGFYGVQSHDRERIKAASYEEWRDAIQDKLDWNRMGVLPENRGEYLKNAYETFSTGQHLKFGGANLAKKVSESRDLHFIGPEAWLKYNDQFGSGTYYDTIAANIQRGSRDVIMMEEFGVNPSAMHEKLTSGLSGKEKHKMDAYFNQMSGSLAIPADPLTANIGLAYRSIQQMSLLGRAFISMWADVPIKVVTLNRAGMGFFDAWRTSFTDIFSGMEPQIADQIKVHYGVGLEGMISGLSPDMPTFSAARINAATNTFFKLNLQHWWTNKAKLGTARALSSLHASMAGKGYNDLPADMQASFSHYGIGAKEWDVIRASVSDIDNTPLILRDMIPDKKIADKYGAMIIDRVDTATLTGGTAERVATNRGLKSGTLEGELVRCIMQFKNFPITFGRRVWGEILTGGRGEMARATHLIAGTLGIAYLSDFVRQGLSGREQPDINDPSYVAELFMRSGVGALYGDLLIGTLNASDKQRVKENMAKFAGGPILSDAFDVATLTHETIKEFFGKDGKPSKELLNLTLGNMPGSNLFYVRPVADYMLFNSMKEWADPGYGERIKGFYENKGMRYFDSSANIAAPNRRLLEDLND